MQQALVYLCIIFILLVIMNEFIIHFPEGSEQWRKVSAFEWRSKRDLTTTNATTGQNRVAVVCYDHRLHDYRIEKLKKWNEAYCQKHGYDFLFYSTYYNDHDLPPYWLKVQIVKDVLETDKYDFVMWIDSDACFQDFAVKIERLFAVYGLKQHFMIIGPDLLLTSFNAGVWVLKNTARAKEFMTIWLAEYLPSKWKRIGTSRWKCKGFWAGQYYEQGSGRTLLLSQEWSSHVIWIDDSIWQSPGLNKDAFVFHFYGACAKPQINKLKHF